MAENGNKKSKFVRNTLALSAAGLIGFMGGKYSTKNDITDLQSQITLLEQKVESHECHPESYFTLDLNTPFSILDTDSSFNFDSSKDDSQFIFSSEFDLTPISENHEPIIDTIPPTLDLAVNDDESVENIVDIPVARTFPIANPNVTYVAKDGETHFSLRDFDGDQIITNQEVINAFVYDNTELAQRYNLNAHTVGDRSIRNLTTGDLDSLVNAGRANPFDHRSFGVTVAPVGTHSINSNLAYTGSLEPINCTPSGSSIRLCSTITVTEPTQSQVESAEPQENRSSGWKGWENRGEAPDWMREQITWFEPYTTGSHEFNESSAAAIQAMYQGSPERVERSEIQPVRRFFPRGQKGPVFRHTTKGPRGDTRNDCEDVETRYTLHNLDAGGRLSVPKSEDIPVYYQYIEKTPLHDYLLPGWSTQQTLVTLLPQTPIHTESYERNNQTRVEGVKIRENGNIIDAAGHGIGFGGGWFLATGDPNSSAISGGVVFAGDALFDLMKDNRDPIYAEVENVDALNAFDYGAITSQFKYNVPWDIGITKIGTEGRLHNQYAYVGLDGLVEKDGIIQPGEVALVKVSTNRNSPYESVDIEEMCNNTVVGLNKNCEAMFMGFLYNVTRGLGEGYILGNLFGPSEGGSNNGGNPGGNNGSTGGMNGGGSGTPTTPTTPTGGFGGGSSGVPTTYVPPTTVPAPAPQVYTGGFGSGSSGTIFGS